MSSAKQDTPVLIFSGDKSLLTSSMRHSRTLSIKFEDTKSAGYFQWEILPYLVNLKELKLTGYISWPGKKDGLTLNETVNQVTLSNATFISWASFDGFMVCIEKTTWLIIRNSTIVNTTDEIDPCWRVNGIVAPLDEVEFVVTEDTKNDMIPFAKYAATTLSAMAYIILQGPLKFVFDSLT